MRCLRPVGQRRSAEWAAVGCNLVFKKHDRSAAATVHLARVTLDGGVFCLFQKICLKIVLLELRCAGIDLLNEAAIRAGERTGRRLEIEHGAALLAWKLAVRRRHLWFDWRRSFGRFCRLWRRCAHGFGSGGGVAPNNTASSGTVPAAVQPAIPCRQTSVSRVREPSLVLPASVFISNTRCLRRMRFEPANAFYRLRGKSICWLNHTTNC